MVGRAWGNFGVGFVGRPLHPCGRGCCASRADSVDKGMKLIERVVLKRIPQPAQNKWTKMDPAFCQATLVACFFGLVKSVLEVIVSVTYEALTAMTPAAFGQFVEEDVVEESPDDFKGRARRYGRRCLAFIGDPDTRWLLLTWTAVGQIIMIVHYRLFKHVTWFSHFEDADDRCSVFDFCHGSPGQSTRNPAVLALCALATMLFDPDHAGQSLWGPLYFYFGGTVHWPEKVFRTAQGATILAFCKLWRALYRNFKRAPFSFAHMFHPDLGMEARSDKAQLFWGGKACSRDPWMGEPLRTILCETWQDLLKGPLQRFLRTMFERSMLTSTFAERLFAPLTQWTCQPKSRLGLPMIAAKHVNTVFDEGVQRWGRKSLTMPSSTRERNPVAYTIAAQTKQNAWHSYVEHQHRDPAQSSFDHIVARRAEFNALPAEEKKPWAAKAKAKRTAASGQKSPLDALLCDQSECEVSGGPWGLAASRGNSLSEWPLSRESVDQASRRVKVKQTAADFCKQQSCVWGEAADFPRTVSIECACYEGECVHDLTPAQEHSFRSLQTLIRLTLRHHGLGAGQPLCLEFRSGSDVVFALIGDNAWTHCLECDFLPLERLADCEGHLLHLGIAKELDKEDVKFGWPQIESETAFLLRLLCISSAIPWTLYCLQTVLDQMSTYLAVDRTIMDVQELQEKEAKRLELAHAMRLYKKITEPKKDEKFKEFNMRRRRGGRGRGRGRGRGEGDSPAVSDQNSVSDQDSESSGFVVDEAVSDQELQLGPDDPKVDGGGGEPPLPAPPPAPPPPPLPAAGNERWGNGRWDIGPVRDKKQGGLVIGCGSHCRGHHDDGNPNVCKKSVTFGLSGLSYACLRLRMKRWLIAGLDDEDWDADAKRLKHVSMGGVFLREFADGLSEEDCDRIANAQVAAG